MLRKFLRCRRVSAVALALIAGMLAAHFYAIPLWCWGVAALLGLGGACAWRRPGRVGLMLIGVAGLGAALLLLAETRPALPAEEDVTLEGIVAEAPTYQADRGRAVLVVQDGALGKVRLYLTAEEEAVAAVRVGDFVRANARLWLDAPEDFALYLWRYGIVASAFAEEAAFEPGGFSAARALDSVRAGISGKIDALFPHTADLVKALILGDRSELAEEQNDAYARAGVAHLLAVSGLHVSIIAGLFDQALRKLRVPRLVVLCVVFCALLAYSVLVGMGASIVRAVLMYAIAGVGRQLGRPRDGVQCLSVAAVIQLLIQPLWLFDAGFILSYTAIAGIQLVGEPLFQRVKGRLRHQSRAQRGAKFAGELWRVPRHAALRGGDLWLDFRLWAFVEFGGDPAERVWPRMVAWPCCLWARPGWRQANSWLFYRSFCYFCSIGSRSGRRRSQAACSFCAPGPRGLWRSLRSSLYWLPAG